MLNELIDEIEERLRLIIREEIRSAQGLNNPQKPFVPVEHIQPSEKKKTSEFPAILGASDIAEMLGINKQRVYELVRSRNRNGFPVILLGERQYRFSKEAVLEWINQGGSIK